MEFFMEAVDTVKIIVIGLGAAVAGWGAISLMEGYGNDNAGAKSQGIKQVIAGGGIAFIGLTLIPQLANIFS